MSKIVLFDNSSNGFSIKITDGQLEIEADGLVIENRTDEDLINYYLEIRGLLKDEDKGEAQP